MKLYTHPRAPNPNRVKLYLAEKAAGGAAIDLPQVKLDLRGGEQNTPAFLARNYFGAVPVLELDDGSHIIESLTIIEYLEECYPEPAMIGRTALQRARVRELERIAELRVLRPIGRIIHATNSPLAYPPNPGMAQHFRKVLPIGLRFFDERLADGRPFIAGEQPSIADCTLAAAFKFAGLASFRSCPASTTSPAGTRSTANARR